jgi:CBS domain-containing protein
MKARDLMTKDPVTVTPGEPISRAAEIMHDLDVGIVPVVEEGTSHRLVGVLTDRDIAVRCVARKHGVSCAVREHMTTGNLRVAHPDDEAEAVLHLMEDEQVRRIPVVDDDSRLLGIIAQADVAMKYGPRHPLKMEHMLERLSATHAV